MIYAAVLIVALALFTAYRFGLFRRGMPNSLHLGPIVRGKNYTHGTKLEGQSFAFPQAPGEVDALVKPVTRLGATITLRYRIEADEGVTFHPAENPTAKPTISLMIQRKGDDYSAKGAKAFYRLYAPPTHEVAVGEHEMTVKLGSPGWFGVFGKAPSPAQWADMLGNVAAVHVCFGGGGGRSHGVFASGPARFTLLGLETA
jgi:hypothetical protein